MLLPVHIALLELKRYLVNRGELAFSLALPIALFALVYGAFGGESSFHATAHVVDLDGGPHARDLIDRLDATDEITPKLRTLEDAEDALDRSAILTAIVIPSGFSTALESGESAVLKFRQRGNGGETGQIVASIVRSAAQQLGSDVQVRRVVSQALAGAEVPKDEIEAAVRSTLERARITPPIGVTTSGVEKEAPDVADRMVPGLLVMFLMFAVTLGAQTLVEERRLGTLERLMTMRLTVSQLFVGKYLSGVLRAWLQAVVLLSLAFAVLGIGDYLDFAQLVVVSAFVASAVSAIGLVIGAAARTRDQAIWAAVVFTMFMAVFGGTFFDVGSDGPLALLSKFTLNRYAIEAMADVLSAGEGLAQQGVGLAVLTGVAIIGLLVARTLFRVSEGGR